MIIAIDAGNHAVKVVGERGAQQFLSCLGERRERKLVTKYGEDDMEFEWNGRTGFAGSLAKYESEFVRSIKGDTKAHEDAQLRVLLALHRYCRNGEEVQLVVGQPISRHEESEKLKIKKMLQGRHTLVVNGVRKQIQVDRVEVAAEGAGAYWCSQRQGIVRVIDIGSGTVNLGSVENTGQMVRFIDKDSDTITQGVETNKSNDIQALAEAAAAKARDKWRISDAVLVAGGVAEQVLPTVKRHFPRAETITPVLKHGLKIQVLHPVFANALGFYELGRAIYV